MPRIARLVGMALIAMCSRNGVTQAASSPVTPESCNVQIITANSISGSRPYVRLMYVIQALGEAQESLKRFDRAMQESKDAASPILALAALLNGVDESNDDLLCAAAIIDHFPVNKDDGSVFLVLSNSFRIEAKALSETEARMKDEILHPERHQTGADLLKDAEQMAAIQKAQDGAASHIDLAVSFAFLKTVDLSNPKATTTELLAINCDEYKALLDANTPLAREATSAYSQAAGLIQYGLETHKCRSKRP